MNRLLLLATGGTIAGCAENSATLNNYTAGVLRGDALLAAVPQLQDLARIGVEQIANCLLYTSPSPRDISGSRMPSSA